MANHNYDKFQILSTAWELASFSLRYPTRETLDAVMSRQWEDTIVEISVTLSELSASKVKTPSYEKLCLTDSPDAIFLMLRTEATRLFLGAPVPIISPYEGIWSAIDNNVQPLLIVNSSSLEVSKFMNACGISKPDSRSEPVDHIAIECEFLEYLCLRTANINIALETPLVPNEKLPGGSSQAAYHMFLNEHFLTWAERFAEKLESETTHGYYKNLSKYLNLLCKCARECYLADVYL